MNEKILFSLSYGLFVLTADEYKDNGCIINTVNQVANNPVRIAISVSNSNLTCSMIKNTGKFNLNVLAKTVSFDIFKRFGFQSGRSSDKFDGFEFKRSSNGLAYLTRDCIGYISCVVKNTLDLGSHTLFIAEMTDSEILLDAEPVTYAYYHSNIKPKQQTQKKTGYVCSVCGYVYEGETLPPDFICPICKHPASDFTKIE